MSVGKVKWHESGDNKYSTGIDRVVLYRTSVSAGGAVAYDQPAAWNGVTGLTESPSGAEETKLWADNVKYGSLFSAEEFGFTIEAYQSPEEFDECDGSKEIAPGVYAGQQNREIFGLSYRSLIGDDVNGTNKDYEIHLIYGAKASPSERAHSTVNDSPEAETLSWECSTTPVGHNIANVKPIAHIKISTLGASAAKIAALENALYGVDGAEAHAATYAATTDATKQAGKTYYTKDGTTYTEFTGESFANGTTYYEMTSPATEAVTAAGGYLPLPDALVTLMQAAG